jgi:HEAT repeat protein
LRRSKTQLELPRALVGAFFDSYSPTGRAAREMMARLLLDEASRKETREALFAGLGDRVPHIRGTCALLLLQSGESPQPELLRALVGTFAHPDSETARAARELITGLVAGETTGEEATEALVDGLSDDVPDIRRTCDQLLQILK